MATSPKIRDPSRLPMSASIRDNRTKNACAECKRRKVRCDGSAPCYTCRWYKHPERCSYSAPEARTNLSRKSFDALRQRLYDTTNLIQHLFPSVPLEELTPLSRDDLIQRLTPSREAQDVSPTANISQASPQSVYITCSSKSPEAFVYDESVDEQDGPEAVADDVNSLSLQPDRISSYVGPSSAMASLRVLLNIVPKTVFSHQESIGGREEAFRNTQLTRQAPSQDVVIPTARDPQRLVDAYFFRIHPSTPILDEDDFRATFTSGQRKDPAWLALLNMVLALGVIAYTKSESFEDVKYYNAAKAHIGIESLGSGHIETLQALALMSGWYLHYRNRPNTASAIMGAVFRMANALGLHKELPIIDTRLNEKQKELRRRIWWTLVVLDAGEATTLGRVSNANLFSSEVNLPSNRDDETGEASNAPTVYSTLIADIEFARQASRIQESLISSQQLEFTDILTLDANLVYWFENLPSYLRAPAPCPDWLVQPRATSKWRYYSLRIILHRPVLMEAALRRTELRELSHDQRVCVSKCQSLARSLIETIASEWTPNQYSGWPAFWYLFQACTIPLLSLYTWREQNPHVGDLNYQVQTAIRLFKDLQPWDNTAKRTHDLMTMLYGAYTRSLKPVSSLQTPVPQASFEATMVRETALLQQQQQSKTWSDLAAWDSLYNFQDLDLDFLEMGPSGSGWDFSAELHGFE